MSFEWFKKLNIKFKIALGILSLFVAMFLFATVKRRFAAKDKLKYELSKNAHEIELAKLEVESEFKEQKLKELKSIENELEKKLEDVEKKEAEIGREMSVEELDSFFDSRGF
jgi:recombinational DNA repair ATPase RecF